MHTIMNTKGNTVNEQPSAAFTILHSAAMIGLSYTAFLMIAATVHFMESGAAISPRLGVLNSELGGVLFWGIVSFVIWKISDNLRPVVFCKEANRC